jgi:hypothetical protein
MPSHPAEDPLHLSGLDGFLPNSRSRETIILSREGRIRNTHRFLRDQLSGRERGMSASPPRSDMLSVDDDVRLVPCVDGSRLASQNFTSQHWSVQPCVRPVDAVHMTAGHNALRGSGPGQKPAFCDALALMGCPDRRIDRLCITCCSPSQPSHHAGCRRDLVHAASATGSL